MTRDYTLRNAIQQTSRKKLSDFEYSNAICTAFKSSPAESSKSYFNEATVILKLPV